MTERAKDGLLHLLAATAQVNPPDGAAAAAATIAPPIQQSEAADSLFKGDTSVPSNLFPKGGFSPFPAFPVPAQHLQPTYATAAMAMLAEEQSRLWQL